jgi:heterodisulfide reductase subunit B
MNNKTDQLDEEILFLTKNIDDAIREIIKKECDMMSRDKNKLEQYTEAIVKFIFKNIELEKEIERLKKEFDNSKFGSQCVIHELEYDNKILKKENTELKEKIEELLERHDLLIGDKEAMEYAIKDICASIVGKSFIEGDNRFTSPSSLEIVTETIEKLKNESSELAVKLVEVYQRYDDKPDPNEC